MRLETLFGKLCDLRSTIEGEEKQQPIHLQTTKNLLASVKNYVEKQLGETWPRMKGVATDGGERSLAKEVRSTHVHKTSPFFV